MITTLATAPAAEPIDTDFVKTQLIIDGSALDAEINAMIPVARLKAEQYCGRAFITQTWERYYHQFPLEIELPWAPLQSVSEITYVDGDGATQTLSSSVYTVDTDSEPGLIYPAYDQVWPSTRAVRKAVKVTYVAGYGDDDTDVPDPIRHAIAKIVGSLMHHREDDTPISSVPVPWGARTLLADYRMYKRAC